MQTFLSTTYGLKWLSSLWARSARVIDQSNNESWRANLYNSFEGSAPNYLPEAYEAMLIDKYGMTYCEYENFLDNNTEYLILNGAYAAYLQKS